MKSTAAPNNSFKRTGLSGLPLNSNVGIKSQANTFGLVNSGRPDSTETLDCRITDYQLYCITEYRIGGAT